MLRQEPEGGAARRKHDHARCGGEQFRDLRRRVDHLLEVVEHEQRRFPVEYAGDRVDLGLLGFGHHRQRAGDGREQQRRRANRGNVDEARATGKPVVELPRRLQCEPRLPDAAGAGQRHEAYVVA